MDINNYRKNMDAIMKELKEFEFKGDNPVLDFWKSVNGDTENSNRRMFNRFEEKSFLKATMARNEVVHRFAWAVPNAEAVAAIVKHSPIIEIGAGTGYWANLIEKAGGEIVAFDSHPIGTGNHWHESEHLHYPKATESFFKVEIGGPEKVKEYPKHTLFLCWPPHQGEDFVLDCLKEYNKDIFLYIGESSAATAWPIEFNKWKHDSVMIPQWDGIHDYLMIFNRSETNGEASDH